MLTAIAVSKLRGDQRQGGNDCMGKFESLMSRAETLRRIETNPLRSEWWAGYIRGLRRAHHGDQFGTVAEHELWMTAADSIDEQRAARGRGYRAGLTFESHDPED
jgi:hypothetical protein